MVLQDTRCTQSQSRYYGEQLKQRLGRQAKLFNVEGLAPLNKRGEKKTVRVGGQMFLTDHRVGIYTNDFSPDPTGLGVLSSITITSREAGIGLKVLGTYWPPPNTLDGSLGRQLSLSTNFLHLASQQRSPLTPKQYLQICADKISDTYCSKPNHYAILAGDFNCVWDPLPERTLGAHGHGLKSWATTSSWRHPITTLGFGEFVPAQWISHFSRDGTQGTSWIDHLLVKGSANIRPNYLGIDHSGYWLNVSDHRPVIMGLTAPSLDFTTRPLRPKAAFNFPAMTLSPTTTRSPIFIIRCFKNQSQHFRPTRPFMNVKQRILRCSQPPGNLFPSNPRKRYEILTRMDGAQSWPHLKLKPTCSTGYNGTWARGEQTANVGGIRSKNEKKASSG